MSKGAALAKWMKKVGGEGFKAGKKAIKELAESDTAKKAVSSLKEGAKDASKFIKKHPGKSVAAAAAAGYEVGDDSEPDDDEDDKKKKKPAYLED